MNLEKIIFPINISVLVCVIEFINEVGENR